jgi:biopolymer transport protein ExbD
MMVGGEGGGRGRSQDFELNLASIIDCLTVLIAFMLASASFLSIGILDAGVAAAGTTAASETPPPVNVSIELQKDSSIAIKLSGNVTQNTQLASKEATWDYDALVGNLNNVKAKWPGVNAVILTADNTVEYKHLVKTMEVVRKAMPVVLLGGF